jgi:hypothetical protein
VSYDLSVALPIGARHRSCRASVLAEDSARPNQEDAALERITLPFLGWAHELHVADTEGGCQLVDAEIVGLRLPCSRPLMYCWLNPERSANSSCVRPLSCRIRLTFRPTSLRMSMRKLVSE